LFRSWRSAGANGAGELNARLPELPEHCRNAVEQELAVLDFVNNEIESTENRRVRFMNWVAVDSREGIILASCCHSDCQRLDATGTYNKGKMQ
jgi:hypothetical protein